MNFFKKQRYNSLYKKFIPLRKNVQNRKKIFKFKKQKWHKFIDFLKKQSLWTKRKPYTIYNFHVSKFTSFGNSFKKRFKNDLRAVRSFNFFYGSLRKRFLKTKIKKIFNKNSKNFNLFLLENFEKRLDSVLYRSNFSLSIRNARQMISHGYVLVNQKLMQKSSYLLKQGDLIEIKPFYSNVIKNNIKKIKKSKFWFFQIPPSYLIIKYNTLQIIFGDIKYYNFSNSFSFWLNTNTILKKYLKH